MEWGSRNSHICGIWILALRGNQPSAIAPRCSQIGKAVDLPVAWLAVGADRLVELPQVYRRLDEHSYAYLARSVSYEATLILASNGFVRRYPGLWEMEINREECGDLRRGCALAGPSAGR